MGKTIWRHNGNDVVLDLLDWYADEKSVFKLVIESKPAGVSTVRTTLTLGKMSELVAAVAGRIADARARQALEALVEEEGLEMVEAALEPVSREHLTGIWGGKVVSLSRVNDDAGSYRFHTADGGQFVTLAFMEGLVLILSIQNKN